MKNGEQSVTRLLIKIRKGSGEAYRDLFPIVYDQLRSVANRQLDRDYHNQTHSKTSLVHEVYLKLVGQEEIEFRDQAHFYAIVSRCMRQILIDHARKKTAKKRGGEYRNITYLDGLLKLQEKADQLIHLDYALDRLKTLNPRLVRVVECRYFGEMSVCDTAAVLEVSERTVKRDWRKAKGWLHKELKKASLNQVQHHSKSSEADLKTGGL